MPHHPAMVDHSKGRPPCSLARASTNAWHTDTFILFPIRGNWKKSNATPGHQKKSQENNTRTKNEKNSQDNWHFKPLKDTKRPARTAEQSRQDQKPGELDKAPTSTDHQKIRPGQVTVRKPSSFWIWLFSTMPLGQFEHFFKISLSVFESLRFNLFSL